MTTQEQDSASAHKDQTDDVKTDSSNASVQQEAYTSEQKPESEKRSPQATTTDDSDKPLGWAKLLLIGVGLWFAVFLYSLDQTIVSNAVPSITQEFDSTYDAGWYGSSYLLTFSAFQLLFGRLYSNFSVKYTLLSAIFIFELGSLICGVAPSSDALIAGRAISGVGSAGIAAGAYIVIGNVFPLRVRPICVSSIAMVFAVAAVLGPVLGGIFTTDVTWRWCFYINLPFGGFTAAVLIPFCPRLDHPELKDTVLEKVKKLDILGFFIFMPAIVCLLLALQWGGQTYAWDNARIIVLFILFGLLAIAFITYEKFKGPTASLPIHVATKRSVAAATWNAFCNGAAFFLLIYYIPQWQQVIFNESAAESGINLLPFVLGVVIMANIVGIIVTKWGYYAPFMIAASIITPIGEGLMTTWTTTTPSSKRIGYQALTGLGMGMGQQMPQLAIQACLTSKPDLSAGVSIIILVQTMSGAIFIAVGQAVLENVLAQNLSSGEVGIDAATLAAEGASMLRSVIPADQLNAVLEAYNAAYTRTFLVAAIMTSFTIIGSVCIEWKSVKKAKAAAGGEQKAGEEEKGEIKKDEEEKDEEKV